uniref:Uncharacterized protein n=1 Tax=Anguilla anguilla TaxID=7936 RepID=A0A0E9SAY8_ANGAN
MTKESCDRRR